jgi:hypothetical protein
MKTAEQILDEHCTTVYNKYNGDEEIESSKSAVVIAMEEFAKKYHAEQQRELLIAFHKHLIFSSITMCSEKQVDRFIKSNL